MAAPSQQAFASYAELKHDTILYAKQAIAEGGGDIDTSLHWVEPEPGAFRRLAAAADLIDWLERLAAIADSELRGEPITAEDNSFLENAGGHLESFWVRTSDWELGGSLLSVMLFHVTFNFATILGARCPAWWPPGITAIVIIATIVDPATSRP